jgi:hypothetical protein
VDLLGQATVGPRRRLIVGYPDRGEPSSFGLDGHEIVAGERDLTAEEFGPERSECSRIVTVERDRRQASDSHGCIVHATDPCDLEQLRHQPVELVTTPEPLEVLSWARCLSAGRWSLRGRASPRTARYAWLWCRHAWRSRSGTERPSAPLPPPGPASHRRPAGKPARRPEMHARPARSGDQRAGGQPHSQRGVSQYPEVMLIHPLGLCSVRYARTASSSGTPVCTAGSSCAWRRLDAERGQAPEHGSGACEAAAQTPWRCRAGPHCRSAGRPRGAHQARQGRADLPGRGR